MKHCARRAKCAARLVLAAVLLGGAPGRAEEPDNAETRRIMQEVFGALQTVLPLSLDEKRFADPARRAEIQRALATLSRNAGKLSAHGVGHGQSFQFLSASLAREAAEIERRFAAKHFREAQFELHEFTENCVACHSRLPYPHDAPLSSRFMDEKEIAALPLPQRAQLAMATRQFERALAAQEEMLTSPEFDVGSLDLLAYLDDYIEVCVRVKRDFERPARAIEAFAKRPDLRPALREELLQWVTDLRAFGARPPVEGFEAGRKLAQETEAASAGGREHAMLVRFEIASGALLRYVASLPDGDARAAEAYYWLGVIESRVGRSFWLSQAEPYLEAAIRLAPGDPLAPKAYALLEEFVVGGYSGSSGEHVPADVKAWLAKLHRLIEKAHGQQRS
jgi:tetratricopeptide (TPR) repeat protein